jgi:hypothetical protein
LEKKQDMHLFFTKNDLLGAELSCDFFWIKFKQTLSSCPSVSENIKKHSCLPTQLFWPKKRRFTFKTQFCYFSAYFKALEKKKDLHLFFSKNDLLGPQLSCDFFWVEFTPIVSSCPSVSENIKKNSCLPTQLFWQKKRRFTSKTQLGYFSAYFKALEKKQDLPLFFTKNDLLGPELSCDFFWIKFKQTPIKVPISL